MNERKARVRLNHFLQRKAVVVDGNGYGNGNGMNIRDRDKVSFGMLCFSNLFSALMWTNGSSMMCLFSYPPIIFFLL